MAGRVGLNTPVPVYFDHVCTSQYLRLLFVLAVTYSVHYQRNKFFLSFWKNFLYDIAIDRLKLDFYQNVDRIHLKLKFTIAPK